jgi:pyruvate formate lyase activating enzyme
MIPALFQETLSNQRVRCSLCAHHCVIAPGKAGVCSVRENIDGVLYTQSYGQIIAEHVDPIEKKPLHHFLPGSLSYSIATPGCNFRCPWCQNWEIVHLPARTTPLLGDPRSPASIVNGALAAGCRSIAYTYTEPTVFFEYALETAGLAHEAGIKNVFVTNGYMTLEALETIHPYLDAANVDLKAFRKDTYRKLIGARFQAVLDTLVAMKQLGVWVEVTTLVIPGVNMDLAELRGAADFIVKELGPDTPWHLSRFFPAYRMAAFPHTPTDFLLEAQDIGREAGLNYVYIGNTQSQSHTRCPSCGRTLVKRWGYAVEVAISKSGRCPDCQTEIAGVWDSD